MSDHQDFQIDYKKRRLGFEKAAKSYDVAAVLQREIGDRLFQRLDYVKIDPSRVLDLGAGTGYISKQLLQRYPKSKVVAVDIALNMLKKTAQHRNWLRKASVVCASAESLPFKPDSFDLVISNLMFQWCDNLADVFAGINRVLTENSLLTFSTFGPDTLRELRQSWNRVDGYEHTSSFVDMHDVGDSLMQAGFQQPVVDMETITLTYTSLKDLMRDLKNIGASNAGMKRNRGLTGKSAFKSLEEAYQKFRTKEGLYPLTYEVIYGHAWSSASIGLNAGLEAGSWNGAKVIPITEVD